MRHTYETRRGPGVRDAGRLSRRRWKRIRSKRNPEQATSSSAARAKAAAAQSPTNSTVSATQLRLVVDDRLLPCDSRPRQLRPRAPPRARGRSGDSASGPRGLSLASPCACPVSRVAVPNSKPRTTTSSGVHSFGEVQSPERPVHRRGPWIRLPQGGAVAVRLSDQSPVAGGSEPRVTEMSASRVTSNFSGLHRRSIRVKSRMTMAPSDAV